jgi:glyoxylase-like metal-dependent hydrolase (beta-lactamase superfamily II)
VKAIPFVPPIEVTYGAHEWLSPLVRRVVAENPSKYTYLGTGTYIVGREIVAVIDPGPSLPSHREAMERALEGCQVAAILVTHTHADHSPLARWLAEWSGAPRYGVGPHGPTDDVDDDGGEADDGGDAASRAPRTEEAVDRDFVPDVPVEDGDVIGGPDWTVETVTTPGHTSNHACFALREEATLFSGDHVMGWSTTVISPPDGHMRTYLDSLRKVRERGDAILRPTHGGPVTDPGPYLDALFEHRLERERQVLDSVRRGVGTVAEMVAELYADVRPELHKPAARSVLAHLVKLVEDGLVEVSNPERDDRATLRAVYLPV